jgi:hypothetical protein
MIYTIGNQIINVTVSETNEAKGTPNQIVGWRDVAETCRTLHAVSNLIPIEKPYIVDGIARAGFWGAVFRHIWPGCSLHLNDLDLTCKKVLERNFPKDTITHKSIHKWRPQKCDIALLDFDHFTLKILPKFKEILIDWSKSCKYFIIADGACFGFKFGNMKHYGITNDLDYYHILNETLIEFLDKEITIVSKFVNAATILLEPKKKRKKKIKFVNPTQDLVLHRGKSKLVYKQNALKL